MHVISSSTSRVRLTRWASLKRVANTAHSYVFLDCSESLNSRSADGSPLREHAPRHQFTGGCDFNHFLDPRTEVALLIVFERSFEFVGVEASDDNSPARAKRTLRS